MAIGFDDVRRELSAGNRVLLLVRHAERPRIDQEDPTFGESLPLTENGRRMCVDFGKALAGAATDVQFRASPLRRTVMTAECIAKGMGIDAPAIPEDELIGNGSAFITDRLAVWNLFRDGRFFEHMAEYLAGESKPGFADNAKAADVYEDYVMSLFSARLGIFATHDVFIASYLNVRGEHHAWSLETWPRFLDAAAVIVEPSGTRRYAFLRAGLSDKAMGVDVSRD